MSKDMIIRRQALVENPTPRVPICFVLDASGSMSEVIDGNYQSTGETVFKDGKQWNLVTGGVTRLQKLNEGLEVFFRSLYNDEVARYSAEFSIVAFAGTAETVLDFIPISEKCPSVEIEEATMDGTSIGKAINLALGLLDQRKQEYKDAGVDYFQPWLVLMTDGFPTDTSHLDVAQDIAMRVNSKRLTVFPIGIGEDVDMNVLSMLSPKRPPLRLQGLKFSEFFQWLSRSVSSTSQSTPGETVPLDVDGIKGWAEL